MTMNKRWVVGPRRFTDNVLQVPVMDPYGCVCWLVKRPDGFGSDEDNAALISIAPQLLEACQILVHGYENRADATCEELRAAYEKAKAALRRL